MHIMYVDESTQERISIGLICFEAGTCVYFERRLLHSSFKSGAGEYEALYQGLRFLEENEVEKAIVYCDADNVFRELYGLQKQNKRLDLRSIIIQIRRLLERNPGFHVGSISSEDNVAHFVSRGEDWTQYYTKDIFKWYGVTDEALRQYRKLFAFKEKNKNVSDEDIRYKLSRNILVSRRHKNYYMYGKMVIFVEDETVIKVVRQKETPVKFNDRRKQCLDAFFQTREGFEEVSLC